MELEQRLIFLGLSHVVFTVKCQLYSASLSKILADYISIYNLTKMGIKFPKIIHPIVSQGK